MENTFLDEVLQLYREGNLRDLLKLNEMSDNVCALKLLWVWPSEKNLMYIQKMTTDLGCRGITSIGCGCGLLEWIITKSTGLHVIGYEVNREWWTSKYSNPHFIKLQYSENMEDITLSPTNALLFCYFNNRPAFLEYIETYKGNVVFIIGPGKGKGRHTDPQPLDADFGNPEWQLHSHQEVKDTKDFIAVYVRCIK
ncbi:hypothetical protein JTB14_012330 [Gonioctena quinquepunctata]|nr:hypothetical protein JTB14_012330 [Gonioctena quinquepunctata]